MEHLVQLRGRDWRKPIRNLNIAIHARFDNVQIGKASAFNCSAA